MESLATIFVIFSALILGYIIGRQKVDNEQTTDREKLRDK